MSISIPIEFYFMLFLAIIVIVGNVLQYRKETKIRKMIDEAEVRSKKANEEMAKELRSLNVSAEQLHTFKYHIRMLLIELEKERTLRESEQAKKAEEIRENVLIYKDLQKLKETFEEGSANVNRSFRRDIDQKINRLIWLTTSSQRGGDIDGE